MNKTENKASKTILLTGGNAVNTGDEMMLLVVIDYLRKTCPEVKLVSAARGNLYEHRAKHGLYQRLWTPNFRGIAGTLGYMVFKRYGAEFGIIPETDMDAEIDFSGFSYGDQWGEYNCQFQARQKYRRQKLGMKIAMLPQAFGPFSTESIRDAAKRLIDNVDLVFARDKVSYEHLVSVAGERPNIQISPDFTSLLEPARLLDGYVSKPYGCIVPNIWMTERTDKKIQEAYLPFLAMTVKEMISRGLTPYLLLHTKAFDDEIVAPLQNMLDAPIKVIRDEDAGKLKAILGGSEIVVGSRYHSLISALSQGTPCIATSWSHKYDELFNEYECSEFLVETTISKVKLSEIFENILSEKTRPEIISKIKNQAAIQKKEAGKMLDQVAELIGLKPKQSLL